jgi:hypothetical protein
MREASLATIFRFRFIQIGKSIRSAGWARFLVAGIFMAIMLAVMYGIFAFFNHAFLFLLSEPSAGPAITVFVLEMSFAAVFLLGVASFVIASHTMMYKNSESELLLSLPVPGQTVFAYRFSLAMLLSSWPIFVVAMPAIAAPGITISASWAYYLSAVGALTLFSLLVAVTGGIISFVFAGLMRKVTPILVYLAEIALFFGLAVMGSSRVLTKEVFMLMTATTPYAGEAAVARIRELFGVMPTHHFVEFLTALIPGITRTGSVVSLVFASATTLALLGVLSLLASRLYIPLWQLYRERRFTARVEDTAGKVCPETPFPRVLRWGHGYLFEKDLLAFLRNPEEVSRAAFLTVLLALYILAVRAMAALQSFENVEMFAAAIAFIYVAVGYFTLTICIRFVFPSFSIEGRSAWVVWASPLHMHELFSWKIFFWSSTLFVIMGLVTWISSVLFSMPLLMTLFLLFACACTVVSLVVMSLGQGLLRPNYKDPNPDTLSTSPSGLMATVIGLIYLFIVGRYVYMFALSMLTEGLFDVTSGFGVMVVSLALVITYWLIGHRSVGRLELS